MVDLSTLNILRVPSMIELWHSKKYIKNTIIPHINEKNKEFIGEHVEHETSLMSALAIMRAFYQSLPITIKTFNEKNFDKYIKFIAHSVYVSDLINEAVEHFNLAPEYDTLGGVLEGILTKKESVSKEKNVKHRKMYELCHSHFMEAESLRTQIGLDKDEYMDEINKGLAYSRKEKEFSDKFALGEYDYVMRQLNFWDSSKERENLTNDRVGFIFSYCVDTFHELFIADDSKKNAERRSNMKTWAKNVANALQTGDDDLEDLIPYDENDLVSDVACLKPTPIIINILNIYLKSDNRKMTSNIVRAGLKQTQSDINNYISTARIKTLPGILKHVTELSNSTINKNFLNIIGSQVVDEIRDAFNNQGEGISKYLELHDYVKSKH